MRDDSILCHKEVKGQKMNPSDLTMCLRWGHSGAKSGRTIVHLLVVTELGSASLPELLLSVTCLGFCCWPLLRLVSSCHHANLLLLVRYLVASMYFC
jgi:hypothetical protein